MTKRAVVLGLLGVCFICGFGFFNDFVLRQTYMVGTYMPMPIYGGMILFLLLLNPVLFRLSPAGRRLYLTAGELAVVIALMLFACFIPGRGLMHHGTNSLMLPFHYNKTDTAWQDAGALALLPKRFLADIEQDEDKALGGFVQGMGEGSDHISLSDVPWSAWIRPFLFWGPLLLTVAIALTGLALVVHRQWADHEQIPYPIVSFAQAMLPSRGKAWGEVFSSRLFWTGAAAVFLVHANNYAAAWWPDYLVPVRLQYDFTPLLARMPTFARGGGWGILYPRVLFAVVGFAYLLSTEVSFSMGIAPYAYAYFNGLCLGYGVQVSQNFFALENIERNLYGGAFLGIACVMLYNGRRYYASVLRRSLGLPDIDQPEASAVWGARVLMVAALGFVAQLVAVGIDWQLAALYVFVFLLISTVLSRVVAETGAFFIHCWFYPGALLMSFLGAAAFGPRTLCILFFVTLILMIDPREILMPFAVHAFALLDRSKVKLGKPAMLGVVAVAVGLVVAATATLYWQYDRGAMTVGDGWSLNNMRWPFDNAAKLTKRLEVLGLTPDEGHVQPRGLARIAAAKPHVGGMIGFFSAFGLVLLFTYCRMHFPRFPLHPVLFLVLGSYQSRYMGFSFLLGWLVKALVVKYGGGHSYVKVKPLMLGLIAGEMVAGAVSMAIGAVYYFVNNQPPKPYIILGA